MPNDVFDSQVSDEEHRNTPQAQRRVTVQSGGSPSVPKKFFIICSVGILLMMAGPLAFLWVGWFLVYVGGLILALGLFAAGFLAKSISQNTRLGLILGAALMVGLIVWFFQILVYEWCRYRIW